MGPVETHSAIGSLLDRLDYPCVKAKRQKGEKLSFPSKVQALDGSPGRIGLGMSESLSPHACLPFVRGLTHHFTRSKRNNSLCPCSRTSWFPSSRYPFTCFRFSTKREDPRIEQSSSGLGVKFQLGQGAIGIGCPALHLHQPPVPLQPSQVGTFLSRELFFGPAGQGSEGQKGKSE